MIFSSCRPPLSVPTTDVLSYMFDDWKHSWNKPLFIDAEDPSHFISAAELASLARRIGCGLRESANVRSGDVVLLSSANGLIIPPLMLGIICAGAIITGANPTFSTSELSYQIKDAGVKAIFASSDTVETVLQSVGALGLPRSIVYLISLEKETLHGVQTLAELLTCGEMDWERFYTEQEMRERIVAINYSSGTTGLPKGCMITVYNVIAQCEQYQIVRELSRQELRKRNSSILDCDTLLAYMPFYHAFAQQQYVINAARNGDTTYVVSSFSFPALLRYIQSYRLTAIETVPRVIVQLAKDPDVRKTDFSSVHSVLCGAAPLGADTQLQAEEAMNTFRKGNVRIYQGWGMTEAVCGICKFALHERDPDISGVGYLYSGMSACLVPIDDPSYSKSLGKDQEGEVLLKGPNIFSGYWNKEKETQEAFTADGWYKTGDVGVMRRDGIMHIVDRKKELIKVRGLQVAPAELEEFLFKHPYVEDVAVIGIQGQGTEHPRAYIVPSASQRSSNRDLLQVLADDILTYVANGLAKHKRLTGGIVFVETIPKNPSGKILRRLLRDQARVEQSNEGFRLSHVVESPRSKL